MRVRGLRSETRGATVVEYGLVAGLIAVGLILGLQATRSSLSNDYSCIASSVGGQGSATCATGAPTPATALGYAMQMVPPGRSVVGLTKDTQGRTPLLMAMRADPNGTAKVSIIVAYDPSYSPNYTFMSNYIGNNVYAITSYGDSPTATGSGVLSYFVSTPQGDIFVDTIAAQ